MSESSTQGIRTVLHPVSDLAAAKAVYTALLGIPPQADGPHYIGFEAAVEGGTGRTARLSQSLVDGTGEE